METQIVSQHGENKAMHCLQFQSTIHALEDEDAVGVSTITGLKA